MVAAERNSRINEVGVEDPEFEELREYLVGAHDPSIKCTTEGMTKIVTERVAKFFADRGYDVGREVVTGAVGRVSRDGTVVPRRKRPDLVVHRENGPLAVEIDSSPKGWSLKKLRYAKKTGYDVLWIRWDREELPGQQDRFEDDVPTIGLRLLFISAEKDTAIRPTSKPKAINARNLTIRQVDPTLLPQNASPERQAALERRREGRQARGITRGTRKNSPGRKPYRSERRGMTYRSPVRTHDLPCPKCGKQDCAGFWHEGDGVDCELGADRI